MRGYECSISKLVRLEYNLGRKKKKSSSFLSIPLFSGKKKTKRQTRAQREAVIARRKMILGISASIIICTAAAVGFVLLDEKNVEDSHRMGKLYMPDRPDWYNDNLDNLITMVLDGSEFPIEPGMARFIAERLESLSWLYGVKVTTVKDGLSVFANYRKPVAVVKVGGYDYYLDADMTVMEYVPLGGIMIVRIEGLESRVIASPGQKCNAEDAAAAVKLIDILSRMDDESTPDKPLLGEIKSINVANYNGRKRSSHKIPHILLYANDGTEIQWGAAIGQSARYFEATDAEKLAQLYSNYKKHGTVQGSRSTKEKFKYLDLRFPQKKVPMPQ